VALLEKLITNHTLIVTVEENALMSGAGSAVLEALQALKSTVQTLCLGLPDRFIEHGVHETMLSDCGLDAVGILKSINAYLKP
jgi:1-deoxy-D-xylulose-5-phosphate synthase